MAKGKAMKVKSVEPKGLTVSNKKIPVVVIVFAIVVVVGLVFLVFGVINSDPVPVGLSQSKTASTTQTDTAADEEEPVDNSGGITELAIDDTKKGKGTALKEGDKATVNYTGKLYTNGTVFDSNVEESFQHVEPFEFTVGSGVIEGWSEGVIGMKVGGKRTITIPPDLGYGATAQTRIPANSTLVFEIELLSINGKTK